MDNKIEFDDLDTANITSIFNIDTTASRIFYLFFTGRGEGTIYIDIPMPKTHRQENKTKKPMC